MPRRISVAKVCVYFLASAILCGCAGEHAESADHTTRTTNAFHVSKGDPHKLIFSIDVSKFPEDQPKVDWPVSSSYSRLADDEIEIFNLELSALRLVRAAINEYISCRDHVAQTTGVEQEQWKANSVRCLDLINSKTQHCYDFSTQSLSKYKDKDSLGGVRARVLEVRARFSSFSSQSLSKYKDKDSSGETRTSYFHENERALDAALYACQTAYLGQRLSQTAGSPQLEKTYSLFLQIYQIKSGLMASQKTRLKQDAARFKW